MKIKEYNQMMKYLTREKEPTIRLPVTEYDDPIEKTKVKKINKKSNIRQETMPERIERVVYQYDSPKGMKQPKHMDNKNIKTFEEMQTINQVIDYSPIKTKRPVTTPVTAAVNVNKPFKKIKKIERPVNIDISGINTDLNKYEQILSETPEPKYELPKEDKLEGIETILGIKA
jgi:hypothetical protein